MTLARRRPCAESGKVAMPVGEEHHGFAIEQGVVDGQGPHRLDDSRQLVGEVSSVSRPKGDAIGGLAGEQAIAVVLDLVNPLRARSRLRQEHRPGRGNEAGRGLGPGTLRGNTPQHAPVYKGPAISRRGP
jgi:hypothetical protein